MPNFMNDAADLASDAMKYKTIVDGVINSGILDDNEELKEKLNTAVDVVDKAQHLREVATILEKLGWIEEGGTISKVAISSLGNAGPILSNLTAAGVSTGTVASVAGVASTTAAGTVAGIVGGTAAGVGTAAALGGTAAGVVGATAAVATAPLAAGVAVTAAVGYGISKLWSSIFD